jgi:hypothetical protein
MLGLGLAYAGRKRAEVAELLLPVASDPDVSMEVAGIAALSLGLVMVGTANGEAVESLLQVRCAGKLLRCAEQCCPCCCAGRPCVALRWEAPVLPTCRALGVRWRPGSRQCRCAAQ